LDQSIWSLTSSRAKRISGSKNFCSTPQKDFCNNIGQQATSQLLRGGVASGDNVVDKTLRLLSDPRDEA
jgi:hypothetical protein